MVFNKRYLGISERIKLVLLNTNKVAATVLQKKSSFCLYKKFEIKLNLNDCMELTVEMFMSALELLIRHADSIELAHFNRTTLSLTKNVYLLINKIINP